MENIGYLADRYEEEVISLLFPHFHDSESDKIRFANNFRPGGLGIELSPYYVINPKSDFYFPQNGPIVHFTSKWGLFSMLNERCFRQYQLNSTNDLREANWLGGLLKIEGDQLNEFKQKAFFGSFCKQEVLGSKDELLFWRLYAQNAHGVAIKFNLKNAQPHASEKSPFLGRISYKLPKGIRKFNQAHARFVREYKLTYVDNHLPLCLFACFHKSPSFKHEKEVRLISHAPDVWELEDYYNFGLDYKREKLVYYKKLPICFQEREPYMQIEEIYLGPGNTIFEKQEFQLALLDALMLAKLGYNTPQVKISAIKERVR